ncbi:MAG: 16S rRNA (guanine(527)-N(7))-methyltransferase RsmG [Deltaproteobacteria bacterium]|nr:16S rRNA (guanine(527)-N(7))-methyltransferase RsmG [Deltaproteobacteria bacterium]
MLTRRILNELGLLLSLEKIHTLKKFKNFLYASNNNLNLTRVPPSDFTVKHVIDSLLLAPFLNLLSPKTVLDFGTGGGFPGVPLAIFLPRIKFFLFDKSAKKTKYLRKARDNLQLDNVSVLEEVQRCDCVVSRAVAGTNELIQLTKDCFSLCGLALKSEKVLQELRGISGYFFNVYAHELRDFPLRTRVIVYSPQRILLEVPNFKIIYSG